MEDIKTQLTDEQVNEFIKAAESENSDNENIQSIRDVKGMPIEDLVDQEDSDEGISESEIDPKTGIPSSHVAVGAYGMGRKENLFDDFLDDELKPAAEADSDITEGHVSKALKEEHIDVKLVTVEKVKELIIRRNKGEKIKYADLPEDLQKRVNETVSKMLGRGYVNNQLKMARNMMADDIIESLYTGIVQEKINNEVVDLETSIRNLAKDNLVEVTSDQRKQHFSTFVIKFPQMADQIESTDPAKAKLMRDVSKGFEQAHSMEDMYKAYSDGKVRIRKIDIEKLDKTIRRFNSKYENSKMVIRDISNAEEVLARHVHKMYSQTAIKAFVVLICKYCENMSPDNLAEHTFMYYLINNILSLDVPFTNEADIMWNDEFINNINRFLALIEHRNFK